MLEKGLGVPGGLHVLTTMSEAPPTLSYSVRPGTAADLAAVHELVEELAVYEEAAREVATTADTFRLDLADNWFELLVAEDDRTGRILGMMLYYRAYSTWKGRMTYLEDFVVARGARRKGVGRALWSSLVDAARAAGSTSVKWQVLDWNEDAKAFYREVGAEIDTGWDNGRLYL